MFHEFLHFKLNAAYLLALFIEACVIAYQTHVSSSVEFCTDSVF